MKPLISVIIPTYNRRDQLLDTISSAMQQRGIQMECIVVIDGSTDGTYEAVSSLSDTFQHRLRVLSFTENRGVSAARNAGIKSSSGEFIATLDDDDLWEAGKLAIQLDAAQHLDQPLVCTTDYRELTQQNLRTDPIKCADCMTLSGQIKLGRFPPPSTWLFSRSAFDAVGGFDELLHAGEDADFITELRKSNAQFINVDQALTVYRCPPDGKVYRDQEVAAARTMVKHYRWRREVLTTDEFNAIMDWYKKVLPIGLFQRTMDKIHASID